MDEVKQKKSETIAYGSPEWKALVETICNAYDVGQLIPHDWLRQMFGIKDLNLREFPDLETVRKAIQVQQFLFLQLFEKLRKDVLENHDIYLVNVRGQGYRIIHPKDQTQYAYDQLMRDIKSSFKECSDIMTHVRPATVSEEQRATDRMLFSKMGALKQVFSDFRK